MCKASWLNVQKKIRKAAQSTRHASRATTDDKSKHFSRGSKLSSFVRRLNTMFVVLGSCARLPTSLVAANCCWWWWCASKEARTHMAETLRLRHGTCPLEHPNKTHANMQQLGNSRRSSLTESGEVRLRNVHAWQLEQHVFRTYGRPHPQTTNVEPTISA